MWDLFIEKIMIRPKHNYLPRIVTAVAIVLLSFPSSATSQVMGRTLEEGNFEVGYSQMHHKRFLSKYWLKEASTWGTHAVYIRYGVFSWLTVCIEGFLSAGPTDKYPQRDYRDLEFGGGITLNILSVDHFNVNLANQYNERFLFDRSSEHHHKQVQSLLSELQIQYIFLLPALETRGSVAPIYLFDQHSEYTPYYTYTEKSIGNLGVSLGIDFLVLNHVRLHAQALFTNFWQTRTGFGWVF